MRFKVGDRFTDEYDFGVFQLIAIGSEKIELIIPDKPSASWKGDEPIKVKDNFKITLSELNTRDWKFAGRSKKFEKRFTLIED